MRQASTAEWPASVRLRRWEHVLKTSFAALRLEAPGHSIDASLTWRTLGPLQLSELLTTPCRLVRDADHLHADLPASALLAFVADGGLELQQGKHHVVLNPGDAALLDPSRPSMARFMKETRVHSLVLPRHRIALSSTELAQAAAKRIEGAWPMTRIVASLVAELTCRELPHDPHACSSLASALSELAAELLRQRLAGIVVVNEQDLVRRVEAYVDHHLGDPALNPRAIAEAHHVSLRTLHRLFEQRPHSVAELIRDRRLQRAREDLAAPALAHVSVTEIAARYGVEDSARFSTMFRRAFAMSPNQFRRQRLAGDGGPLGAPAEETRCVTKA